MMPTNSLFPFARTFASLFPDNQARPVLLQFFLIFQSQGIRVIKISGDSCLGESGIFCNVSKGDFLLLIIKRLFL